MEKFILLIAMALLVSMAHAQKKEGKIIFERTQQLQIQLATEDESLRNMVPRERKDRFETLFANNQSVWRPADDDPQAGDMTFHNGGAEIRMVMPGSNDIIFNDFNQQRRVEQRELMTKTFVIQDSIRRLNWKLGEETKTILGYTCRKATTQRTQSGYRVMMENGSMNRQQVTDTVNIVAWFTDGLGTLAGPDIYQGQLPGTVLEVDINNGRTRYVAQEINPKMDSKDVKEPKGKKISPEEFAKEREKMFKEMQENNGGGRFNMRVGG